MRLTSKSGFGVMLLGINLWFGLGSRFWVPDLGCPIFCSWFGIYDFGLWILGSDLEGHDFFVQISDSYFGFLIYGF